jgi:hypothetical protein
MFAKNVNTSLLANINAKLNTLEKINIKSVNIKESTARETCLSCNSFEPLQNSPPNDFILKLKSRIIAYNDKQIYNITNNCENT